MCKLSSLPLYQRFHHRRRHCAENRLSVFTVWYVLDVVLHAAPWESSILHQPRISHKLERVLTDFQFMWKLALVLKLFEKLETQTWYHHHSCTLCSMRPPSAWAYPYRRARQKYKRGTRPFPPHHAPNSPVPYRRRNEWRDRRNRCPGASCFLRLYCLILDSIVLRFLALDWMELSSSSALLYFTEHEIFTIV